jgi:predicted RNA-binding Zn-ribbon protein involved in translation (DUF1610 family)
MENYTGATHDVNQELACCDCGATLKFAPGTYSLSCDYCGASNEIAPPNSKTVVEETNLDKYLVDNFEGEDKISMVTVKCTSCGSSTTLKPNITSDNCPFCDSALVVENGSLCSQHKPQYILPFQLDAKEAVNIFKKWLKKLWFAPNDLEKLALSDKLTGMYVPFWTYDCTTQTSYSGQRGIDYQTTESYKTVENGETITKTRTVTKTKWQIVKGKVTHNFDDIVVPASRSMNREKLQKLEPWDLPKLVGYDDRFLSGFKTETYQVSLKEGYVEAKQKMQGKIEQLVKRDIGGDRQRISSMNTDYKNPSFKHILLPVWISAFRYKGKVYQFLVNARTGEVQGERPYSPAKIILFIVMIIIAIGLLMLSI